MVLVLSKHNLSNFFLFDIKSDQFFSRSFKKLNVQKFPRKTLVENRVGPFKNSQAKKR